MQNDSALIYLGRINGVHGVRGWVKIHSDCRPREAIFNYTKFVAKRGERSQTELVLLDGRTQGKGLVAKFKDIDDRDSAYALNGLELHIPRSALPAPEDDEYYWADLIGLEVISQDGEHFGIVHSIFETGANDVLVVRDDTGAETLIPFAAPQYITMVDFEQRQIIVDWQLEWSKGD